MSSLLVFVGGGLGALLRYAAGRATILASHAPPFATLGVNILGCLVMGLLAGWFTRNGGSEGANLFLLTGILGSFTTFSAFGFDALTLYRTSPAHAAGVFGSDVRLDLRDR